MSKAHDLHVERDGGFSAIGFTVDVPDKGSVFMEACDTCHEIFTFCNHEKNTWLDREGNVLANLDVDDTSLICNLCGEDVT